MVRHVGGRPRIDTEFRALIAYQPTRCEASAIYGESLMRGIDVADSIVSR